MENRFRCEKCGKEIDELVAAYLHKKLHDLKPGYYYCKKCIEEAEGELIILYQWSD